MIFRQVLFLCGIFTMCFSFLFYRYCRPNDLIVNVLSAPLFLQEESYRGSISDILGEDANGSLPSFLWTFLWGTMINWLWFEEWKQWHKLSILEKWQFVFWCVLPFLACICWEHLQNTNVFSGTADRMDILFGLAGSMLCWCEIVLFLFLRKDSTRVQGR